MCIRDRAEALNQNLGSLDVAAMTTQVDAEKAGLIRLADDPAQPLRSEYATRRGLKSELWSVNFVNKTKGAFPALNSNFEPQGKLSPEQRQAVTNILSTKDQCCGTRGVAGAGKTTLQREVRRGLEEAGHRMIAIAPTASAAKTLRAEGFSEATTAADFLQNGASKLNLHGVVVICDEAGLQSNQQGEELLRLAQKHDMRVIFVGDVRQHVSVEAGDFLRVLETDVYKRQAVAYSSGTRYDLIASKRRNTSATHFW